MRKYASPFTTSLSMVYRLYCFLFFEYKKFAATDTNSFASAQSLTPPSFSPPQCWRSSGFDKCSGSVVPFLGANTRNT
jgi:hypothetical protein